MIEVSTFMGVLLLFFLILAVCTAIMQYNAIIGGHNRVQRGWADVLTYERQKTRMLDALQEQAGLYREHEQKVLTDITRLRSALDDLPYHPNGQALVETEQATQALLSGLKMTFEAYPELRAAEVTNNLMREITEQLENVGAAIVIFNAEVERYNNSLQMFPGSIINDSTLQKSPVTPFSDASAAGAFDYRPNF